MTNKELQGSTEQNNKVVSDFVAISIKRELKARPTAQNLIDDVQGIIIK